MRIWLDDIRAMPEGFDHHCKTAGQAIRFIMTGMVRHISFDHDLGTVVTGYDVAKFIEEMAYRKALPKMTWDVHSSNPVGCQSIAQAMTNADRYWSE